MMLGANWPTLCNDVAAHTCDRLLGAPTSKRAQRSASSISYRMATEAPRLSVCVCRRCALPSFYSLPPTHTTTDSAISHHCRHTCHAMSQHDMSTSVPRYLFCGNSFLSRVGVHSACLLVTGILSRCIHSNTPEEVSGCK